MNPDELVVGKQYILVSFGEILTYTGESLNTTSTIKFYYFKNKINYHNLTKNNVTRLIKPYTKLHESIDLLNAP